MSQDLKTKLSDKILTEVEILQGADKTQLLYQYCIQDTVSKLKAMYPNVDQQTMISTINDSCIYPEDNFSLYNILLASLSIKKPMSEKQASTFIETSYKKSGRDQINAKQRNIIYKNLGLLEE